MAKTNTIGKIEMHADVLPKTRLDLRHDVNTTAAFGDLQPIVCRLLFPKSKTTLSIPNLVRMAPLVSPTFGRLKYKTYSHFVAFSDLHENFPHMLAKTPVARGQNVFEVTSLPHISMGLLSYLVLIGSKCTAYYAPESAQTAPEKALILKRCLNTQNIGDLNSQFDTLFQNTGLVDFDVHSVEFPHFVGTTLNTWALHHGFFGTEEGTALKIPLANDNKASFFFYDPQNTIEVYDPEGVRNYGDYVPLESADYIIEKSFNGYRVALAFRLSDFGKRLRKILIGCGYGIDFNSLSKVSLMPLFSTFKAYYDLFGLQLYENYYTTSLYKLLTQINFDNTTDLNNMFARHEFISFINDLANLWITDQQDFVSAHILSNAIGPELHATDGIIDVDGDAHITEVDNMDGTQVNGHSFIDAIKHGHLDSEYLKRMYLCTNKYTVLGKQVAEILRSQGFGEFVDSCESRFIGYDETDLDISMVVSQSDTFNRADNNGSLLGEYAGLGIGDNFKQGKTPKTFTYENEEYGYWITLAGIFPDSGYCQAIDSSLLAIDAESLYNAKYDALGYEITRKNQIVGSQNWCDNPSEADVNNRLDASFGYVPRYTGLKVANSKANGDFTLRSKRSSYIQYMLDKFIDVGEHQLVPWQGNTPTANAWHFNDYKLLTAYRLPKASLVWRYICRYAFLGNLNRIFANVGEDYTKVHQFFDNLEADDELRAKFEYLVRIDDNFMITNIINLASFAPVKPIERSFETFDEGEQINMSAGKA